MKINLIYIYMQDEYLHIIEICDIIINYARRFYAE